MHYTQLVDDFQQSSTEISIPHLVGRDDIKVLWELGHYYKYYVAHGSFPKIHFKTLAHLNNVKCNSRTIFPLFAFILIP